MYKGHFQKGKIIWFVGACNKNVKEGSLFQVAPLCLTTQPKDIPIPALSWRQKNI